MMGKAENIPGPGNYEHSTNLIPNAPSIKFGSSKRPELGQQSNSSLKNLPGPANYSGDYKNVVSKSPQYRFGRSERNDS